jgi:Skp family chaperone for outer membrane proteins
MSISARIRVSRLRTSIVLTVFAIGSGMVCMAPQAYAQAAAVSAFGSVDLGKVQAGYSKRGDLEKGIADINNRLSQQFKVQSASDMLPADKQKQLGVLLSKPNPTDPDRAQIAALQAQSSHDAADLADLQQKQNPTDTEKARLNLLTAQQQAAHAALQQINQDYTDQFNEAKDKISVQYTDAVRAAIAAVAKDRGLAVVFDSSVAIYSTNDITDDVIKRLNK